MCTYTTKGKEKVRTKKKTLNIEHKDGCSPDLSKFKAFVYFFHVHSPSPPTRHLPLILQSIKFIRGKNSPCYWIVRKLSKQAVTGEWNIIWRNAKAAKEKHGCECDREGDVKEEKHSSQLIKQGFVLRIFPLLKAIRKKTPQSQYNAAFFAFFCPPPVRAHFSRTNKYESLMIPRRVYTH